MKNIGITFAVLLAASPAFAGKGGSAGLIQSAIASHSTDAIIAEVEKTEGLICEECVQLVTGLTVDSRYEVREVAAWWFAKRPILKDMLAPQFVADLGKGDTIHVRNAADFLGATKTFTSLPQLRAAIHRTDLGSDAKIALVRAVAFMSHQSGNEVLTTAMLDGDPAVRAAAVTAWRDILGQANALPALPLLTDADATVRAAAVTVVGGMREVGGRSTLETLVTSDGDPIVRRNAAWALAQIGDPASRGALTLASGDKNGLVASVARAALASLH
jgi:HEAT repeat protein